MTQVTDAERTDRSIKLDAASISVTSIADGFLVWVDCVREPAATCAGLLKSDTKLQSAFRLWVAVTTIGFAINLPAYRLYGIKLTDAGFFVSTLVALMFILLVVPSCIVLTLRMYGISSNASDVLVMYTVVTCLIGPVITLLLLPNTVDTLSLLTSIKQLDLDVWGIAREYFARTGSQRQGAVTPLIDAVATPLVLLGAAAVMSLFSRFVSQRYEADHYTVVSAATMGMLASLVPLSAIAVFRFFVMYAFL